MIIKLFHDHVNVIMTTFYYGTHNKNAVFTDD